MLTIIIAILAIVVAVFLMGLDDNKPYTPAVGVLIIFVAMFVSCWVINEPFYGYKEAVLKEEIDLQQLDVSCKLEDKTDIYLVTSYNSVYLFKPNESDEVQTEGKNNVTYIQTAECEKPILRIYERKPKAGLFSFGGETLTELEFYLPENSVIEVS